MGQWDVFFISVKEGSWDTPGMGGKGPQTYLRQFQVREHFTIDAHSTHGGLCELLDGVLLWERESRTGLNHLAWRDWSRTTGEMRSWWTQFRADAGNESWADSDDKPVSNLGIHVSRAYGLRF